MSRECDICGKSATMGNRIVRHGLAKAKGGIGLHTTGISRRKFSPNLQKIRVSENGGVVRRTVCTACIRSEKVKKG
jgi:large subunit ribosomal protein L28